MYKNDILLRTSLKKVAIHKVFFIAKYSILKYYIGILKWNLMYEKNKSFYIK